MPQVPQYNREVKLNGTAQPYQNYNINENTFGVSIARAGQNMANALTNTVHAMDRINEQIEMTKGIEFNNAIEQWKQDNLFDKEKGYYTKFGKDAVGKSAELLKSYDTFVEDWKSKNKLSRFNQERLDSIATQKRTMIMHGTSMHDLQQTREWAQTEGAIGINNAIKNAVSERNNPQGIDLQIANIKSITQWQGQTAGLSAEQIKAMEIENVSKAYSSILDSKLNEGDTSAKEFFNKHKDEINSNLHSKYIGQIKTLDDKYKSRDLANQIIASSKTEQDAIKKAEAIKDVDMSDSVLSRVKHHYSQEEHFKNQAEKEALDGFYNKVIQKTQNGEQLSYDDIPQNLDPQTKLSLMNYVNKNGEVEDDSQIWDMLYNKSVNDAQGFLKEDLNKYRGYLSDTEYKSFIKKQEEIRAGKYYTSIKDDDKLIDSALKSMGLSGNTSVLGLSGKNKDIAYSEIRAMTREFEARKGRSITDEELQNITNSLGYKGADGVQIYKALEKGMREKVGFIKNVMNDFVYYQNQHDGKMPSDEEKYRIIQNRVNQKVQENKTQAQQTISNFTNNATTMRNIAYTVAKPNEQKVLTYFADNQVPTLEKQLGFKLTVTDRYRNQEGSHHKEGRACDISMSEHNSQRRIRAIEKFIALPTVQAIGTSDPLIIAHFNGNKKIVDERTYDKQHGTNHVNHAHITLINANPKTPSTIANANNNTYRF